MAIKKNEMVDLYEGDYCLLEGQIGSNIALEIQRSSKGGNNQRVRPTFFVHFRTIVKHIDRCPKVSSAHCLKSEGPQCVDGKAPEVCLVAEDP